MVVNSKVIEQILSDFNSDNSDTIVSAIKLNRKEGNEKTFSALLELLRDTDEPLVETSIIEFLYDLKDEKSVPILIDAIRDESYAFYHSFLVASFWQAAIDGSEYIEDFVKAAIKGEYMTSLEALTVVENFDSSFSHDLLLDLEADLNEKIESEENADKRALLVSLSDVVRNLPIEGE